MKFHPKLNITTMAEDKNKKQKEAELNEEQLQEEQLDEVSGGLDLRIP